MANEMRNTTVLENGVLGTGVVNNGTSRGRSGWEIAGMIVLRIIVRFAVIALVATIFHSL